MLTQKSLSTLNFTDDVVSRFQDNVGNCLNSVLSTPLIDGVLVERLAIPDSLDLVVPHGLQRVPRGWIVVNATAYAVASANPTLQTSPKGALVLTFVAVAGTIVSVWVF